MLRSRDILCLQPEQILHLVDMSVPNLPHKVGTRGGHLVDKPSLVRRVLVTSATPFGRRYQ